MSFYAGDMVRVTEESAAFAKAEVDAERLHGIVIKSRKREVHQERGRRGLVIDVAVIDMVEVMWSDGSVQKLDGRCLEKITARSCAQEKDDG